jgi:hypothetical protein
MPKVARQIRTEAHPGPVRTEKAVQETRTLKEILIISKRKDMRSALIASLTKRELIEVVREAHTVNTAKKVAEKDYGVLKDLIKEHAVLKNWTEQELGDLIALFEPRQERTLEPWEMFQAIKQRDLTKEERKALFNKVFSVAFTGADTALGKDVVNKLCQEKGTFSTSTHGALKIKPV